MNLLITNYHPHGGGGHTTYILSLAKNLRKHGIIPIVACPDSSRLYSLMAREGLKVIACDFPNKLKEMRGVARAVKNMRLIIRDNHIDLVHVNGSPDHWILAYYKVLFGSDIPVIRTRHGMQHVPDSLAAKFMNGLISATITVCDAQQKIYSGQRAFRGHRIFVIPNGVDHRHFSPRPASNEIREKYGIKDGDLVIGSTAGIAWYKGVPEFLTAAAPVIKNKRFIKIMLVGGSNPENPYRALTDRLGISENIIFTGFQTDVREYISVFDIGFVFSKSVETISYAAREMMMMGKPVIVSDFGGLPENITDGVDGFVIKGMDVKLLADTLHKISNNRDLAAELGRKARQKAEAAFKEDDFLESTAAAYENCLSNMQ